MSPLTRPRALGAIGMVVVAVVFATRPPMRIWSRGVVGLFGVVAVAMPIVWSDPERALWLALRATLALGAAIAIGSTIPSASLGPALSSLGLPRGVAAVISTLLRQIDLLIAEGRRLTLARRLRGATGLGASTELFAALLVKSSQRAERVELALRLRGYDERRPPAGVALAATDAPFVVLVLGVALASHMVTRL